MTPDGNGIDLSTLNPGVRKLVGLLRSRGFATCDSGDGRTHEFGCDRDYPYVTISVHPADIREEAQRLVSVLACFGGVMCRPLDEAGGQPFVQAYYSPLDDLAHLELINVTDDMLRATT